MVRPKRNNPDVEEFDDPLKNYDDKVFEDKLEQALVENEATAMKITPVETVQASATVQEVVKLMADRNIASVLVVAGDRLAGIFSERDVLNRVADNYEAIKDNPVSEVMTPDPLAIYDTDSPAKAMNIMATGGFRHVPIIDVDERVVGIVGPRRVTQFLMEHSPNASRQSVIRQRAVRDRKTSIIFSQRRDITSRRCCNGYDRNITPLALASLALAIRFAVTHVVDNCPPACLRLHVLDRHTRSRPTQVNFVMPDSAHGRLVITIRETMKHVTIALLLLLLTVSAQQASADKTRKPNIVVFLADDMGWGDSSTYGHKTIKSPNLDKLASQGVKFTQGYSACGVCSPSRAAILTGRTPYRNGVWRHLSGNHDAHLRASEITYPKLLKTIGYTTCHVGKWHLNSKPQFNNPKFPQPGEHGYDHWMTTHNNASPSHRNPNNFYRNGKPVGEMKGYSAPLVAAEATRWLTELRDKTKPFALSVWVHEPHSPIATDPKFSGLYGDHDNSKYLGNITQLDHALGQVMKTLDEQGVADNTLLIFTSDNGPVARFGGTTGGLRGGKRSDHEGGIRVPFVVRWPGHIKPGTTSDVPVVGTDIFATVLAITGIPLPKDRTIDGVNMLPAFEGKQVNRPVPLFWRTHVSQPGDRVALRIGDWKIVGNDTMTKFQLFEIQKDWQEKNDLADKMPDKTEAMKKQLFKVWKDIETEGPDHWWKAERQKPSKGGTVNY